MDSDYQKTIDFLETARYMTIVVVQTDGKPWAVPVRVQRRDDWSFYWDSATAALHSHSIENSSSVMLLAYRLTDGDIKEFGFYAEAAAKAVEPLPGGRMRYRADVQRAWINNEQHTKRELKLP